MDMPEQITQIIIIAGGALGAVLIWALTIAYVYLDSSRRRLPGGEQFIWVSLAALLPLIGFLAYGFARGLARFISPESMTVMEARGATLPRPADERKHTVLAHPLRQPPRPAEKGKARDPRTLSKASQVYTLSIIEGPHTGETFSVTQLPAILGRGSRSDIRLDNDLGISRQHAELYELEGELQIKDLHSSHGTHVNGAKVDNRRLQTGDRVQVGVSILTVKINGVKHAT
jgi:hypothetical protein